MRNIAQMSMTYLSATELEKLGRNNGWSLAALCREAKVSPSNFARWKKGANGMTLRIYERVYSVASRKRGAPGSEAT
ncbi:MULTISPECIES: helix-turn-helix transcriptional regulator [unclassified Acidocella]|uniref:helix-turn-helix transcriptional regulator n=1 Tax=unclassified Acidocella TaxID=2648610 RepID=UPI001969F004|nr:MULTISPECIES: helix-turn-helix transcriptional regulator [unclassified Acidocella]WBO60580.1 hypothetical protein GT370_07355 [Acidocella sp. MX-AZ03]